MMTDENSAAVLDAATSTFTPNTGKLFSISKQQLLSH